MTERKLTKAQISLIKIVEICGIRGITESDIRRHRLIEDFRRCRNAGLIRHAGYETSVGAEDFLNSPAGRSALTPRPGK